jgi:hypothetical protein
MTHKFAAKFVIQETNDYDESDKIGYDYFVIQCNEDGSKIIISSGFACNIRRLHSSWYYFKQLDVVYDASIIKNGIPIEYMKELFKNM